MDKNNNKLRECFIGASIGIFENYYNMVLSVNKENAKFPEHLGTYSYKGKSKEFILKKLSLFRAAGYNFTTECEIPEFRAAMGLKR